MCRTVLIIVSLLLGSWTVIYAQKEANIWYFGDGAGIDFISGSAVAIPGGDISSYEACAVMSDSLGNLLFYTNGEVVWDSNNDTMPNGADLRTGPLGSCTQGALIIPFPKSDSLYYIFTVPELEGFFSESFRYSVVDMSLNSGLGDIGGTKNVLIIDSVTEKLTAIKHSNGDDYWVLVHSWNSNDFLAYLVTDTGVADTPIISSIGTIQTGMYTFGFVAPWFASGFLKASPDGNKLASSCWAMGNLELYDFDNSTGIVSNNLSLPADSFDWGLSFSPDNSKLYVSTTDGPYSTIYQFDLSSPVDSDIINSRTLIDSTASKSYSGIQLAPDGKMYIGDSWYLDTLSVIHCPNAEGLLCDFQRSGFSLDGKFSYGMFPNFMQHYFNDSSFTPCAVGINEQLYNPLVWIYPTISSHSIFIELLNFTNVRVKIRDIAGREVVNLGHQKGKAVELNISNLANGVYVCTVTNSDGISRSAKFVKN